jgi:carbonic anhydrase/acetyltransferase-like protein (isoleucine patch superfamily)
MKLILLNLYWRITRTYLRLRGAEVGHNVRCNGFPYVKVRKGGRLVIEDDVMINAAPWSNAHVTSGSLNIFVAAGASLYLRRGAGVSGTRLVAMKEIDIGQGTFIGGGCLICDSDMHEIPLGAHGGAKVFPIRIGKRAFVGAQSIILKGVSIGDGAVVGAGSTVSGIVPDRALAAGNPAKILKKYL